MTAYYNEIEPYAADWLRELIKKGLIADGIVDTRSIVAVEASDLRDFDQCHFFAGIGVWSHALRLAGWPDDRPVWTGSCPCQPFSAAGKGKGFEDERHLWPVFHMLINECRPPIVFGEQVASKDGLGWLDTVHADMEASGYAIGAADLCAAGVGAPHIRQRLWFVGERLDDTAGTRHVGPLARAEGEARDEARLRLPSEGRGVDGMADTDSEDQRGRGIQRPRQGDGAGNGPACKRPAGFCSDGGLGHHHHQGLEGQRSGHQAEGGWLGAVRPAAEAGEPRGLADADGGDASAEGLQRSGQQRQQPEDGGAVWVEHTGSVGRERGQTPAPRHHNDGPAPGGAEGQHGLGLTGSHRLHQDGARPVNGHWRAADWLHCRDGKWRPVEPGTFPLAHGAPARVGRLRAYGNAIVPQVAAEVISAFMEIER